MIISFINKLKKIKNNLIFENIIWLLLDNALVQLVTFFVGIKVARYLGPENYGLLSTARVITAISFIICTLGFKNVLISKLNKGYKEEKKIISTSSILVTLSGIFALLLMLFISFFYLRFSDLSILLIIQFSSFIFLSSEIVMYWYESNINLKRIIKFKNFATILGAITSISLILNNASVMFFGLPYLINRLVVAVGYFYKFSKDIKLKLIKNFRLDTAKSLLRESWSLILSSTSVVIYNTIDIVMLSAFVTNNEIGIYAAASRLSTFCFFIFVSMNRSITPYLIKVWGINRNNFDKLLSKFFFFNSWLSFFIIFFTYIFSRDITFNLLGDQFVESSPLLNILIFNCYFFSFDQLSLSWYYAKEDFLGTSIKTCSGVFINIILNLILIPKFSLAGAAFATVLSRFWCSHIILLFSKKTRNLLFIGLKSIFSPSLKLAD